MRGVRSLRRTLTVWSISNPYRYCIIGDPGQRGEWGGGWEGWGHWGQPQQDEVSLILILYYRRSWPERWGRWWVRGVRSLRPALTEWSTLKPSSMRAKGIASAHISFLTKLTICGLEISIRHVTSIYVKKTLLTNLQHVPEGSYQNVYLLVYLTE